MFLAELKLKKKTINTIADLRALWSKHEYAKCMRIVSYIFLRKFALPYIFDSRICTFGSHIKYRQRLCEAVSNPEDFRHIKDYWMGFHIDIFILVLILWYSLNTFAWKPNLINQNIYWFSGKYLTLMQNTFSKIKIKLEIIDYKFSDFTYRNELLGYIFQD